MHFLNCYPKRPGTTISRLLRGQDTGVRTWDVDLKWLKLAAYCSLQQQELRNTAGEDAYTGTEGRIGITGLQSLRIVACFSGGCLCLIR